MKPAIVATELVSSGDWLCWVVFEVGYPALLFCFLDCYKDREPEKGFNKYLKSQGC